MPPASMQRDTAIYWAVGAQLLCGAYLQFIEWVPVFPWNNIANGNKQEVLDVVLAIAQVGIAAAFWFGRRWFMTLGLAAYAGWMYLQLDSWWRPYLFGGRMVGPNWLFARTYKFLPVIGDRPTPDAAHVVLQVTILLVLITGAVAAYRAFQEGPHRSRIDQTSLE